MTIKNIIFDIEGVLADPKSGRWFITPNFWNTIAKTYIDDNGLKSIGNPRFKLINCMNDKVLKCE